MQGFIRPSRQYHSDGLPYHSSVMGLDIQAASGANQYRDHRRSVGVSAALALAGGYLDGFTFVGHGRIFANAMTGNIVYLGMEVLSSPARPNFRHLPPFLCSCSAFGLRELYTSLGLGGSCAILMRLSCLRRSSSFSSWPFFRFALPTSGLPHPSPLPPRCRYSRFVRLGRIPNLGAGIDVDDVGHEFEICTVLQIYRWRLSPSGLRFRYSSHSDTPMGQATGSSIARLGNCMIVISPSTCVPVNHGLTRILVRLHLVGRNFIGESPDLTGWVCAGFLEKRLDRKDRQAGRNSRPEASQPALSTAIHPG
jgi:Protein of unknown function (DUF1275)